MAPYMYLKVNAEKLLIVNGLVGLGTCYSGKTLYSSGTGKWTKVDGSGQIPPPRSAATLDAVDDQLYLFGGLSQYCGWFQDIYAFDTGKLKHLVTEVEVGSQCFRQRGVSGGTIPP
jgi:hypothetical protein